MLPIQPHHFQVRYVSLPGTWFLVLFGTKDCQKWSSFAGDVRSIYGQKSVGMKLPQSGGYGKLSRMKLPQSLEDGPS